MTMKILAKMGNKLLGMRRDNVRPTLPYQLKPLAKKEGGQVARASNTCWRRTWLFRSPD